MGLLRSYWSDSYSHYACSRECPKSHSPTQLVEEAYLIVDNTKNMAFNIQAIQRTTRGYLLQKSDTSLKAYQQAAQGFKTF